MWCKQFVMCSVSAIAAFMWAVVPAFGGTVTWDGEVDNKWSEPDNWDPDGVPQDTDDVVHDLGDTIRLDLGSPLSPEVINSFTGSNGGTLVIEQGKGLRVTGDFTNDDGTIAQYTLTMEPSSLLELDDDTAAQADLSHVDVTMQPVPTGDPSKLLIDGAIIGGDFDIGESNIVEVGRVSGAAKSILWGDWTISNGATVDFDFEMHASDDASLEALTLIIEGGSELTIDEGPYGSATTFETGQGGTAKEHKILYGDGANKIVHGDPSSLYPAFQVGTKTSIGALGGGGSLEMSVFKLTIRSSFEHDAVRWTWDSRNTDIVSRPLDDQAGSGTRIELISPDVVLYSGSTNPVVFRDVPCKGAWRDLILPDAGSVDADPVAIAEESDNAVIDGPAAEVGLFRDVSIGAGRAMDFPSFKEGYGLPHIYYYGTLTIDADAEVLYVGMPVDEAEVTLTDLLTPAVFTDYGDWDGDGDVEFDELIDLLLALVDGEYEPLFDYNCDGQLNVIVEFVAFLTNWGDCHGDLNSDDQVDLEDLELVFDDYGCTSSCTADLDDDDDTDVNDFKAWEKLVGCGVSGGYMIEDAMDDIGLDTDDWEDFLYYVENGTQAEHDNYLCWMDHYVECHAPGETCNGTLCTDDPFGGHQ